MFIENSYNDISKPVPKAFPMYNYAVHCRQNEDLCGYSGYLYEPNDNIDYIKKKLENLKKIDSRLYEYNQFLNKKKYNKM
jgi:hypothetical protein